MIFANIQPGHNESAVQQAIAYLKKENDGWSHDRGCNYWERCICRNDAVHYEELNEMGIVLARTILMETGLDPQAIR